MLKANPRKPLSSAVVDERGDDAGETKEDLVERK